MKGRKRMSVDQLSREQLIQAINHQQARIQELNGLIVEQVTKSNALEKRITQGITENQEQAKELVELRQSAAEALSLAKKAEPIESDNPDTPLEQLPE